MEEDNAYFQNEFGNVFILFSIQLNNSYKEKLEFYVCTNCNKCFVSKKGMLNHDCLKKEDDGKIRYKNTLKYLYIWLSKKNVTFHSLYDADFQGFLFCLNKEFELPPETTLRRNIKQFADYIESRIFQLISNLPVSILMDGVTRHKKKYQGIIIFTPDQLYFLKLVPCETETSDDLAAIIAQVANEIKFHGGKLISVCTDNAANNIAALKGNAQDLSEQSFIRFPCVCHTTNLAGHDVFSEKYSELLTFTLFLIEKLNILSKLKVFTEKVPQFKEVRWFSLAKCVLFILTHSNFLDAEGKNAFNYINDKYNWIYVSSNLNAVKFLICKLEKDSVSIADIYLNLLFCLKQLTQISYLYPKTDDINLSKDLYDALLNRFSTTVQMHLPILAFFLTGEGLKNSFIHEINTQIIPQTKEILKNYLEKDNNADTKALIDFFEKIMQNSRDTYLFYCNTTLDSVAFWRKIIKGEEFWISHKIINENEKKIQISFAKVALEILTIPCSECACERCFSHLGDILMNNKRHMSFDMLNSLMQIRMNSIFLKQRGIDSNHFIFHELQKLYQNDDEASNTKQEFEHDPLVFFLNTN